MFRRTACLLVLAVFFTVPLTAAQDSAPARGSNTLRSGAWALQFGIAPDQDLRSFDAGTITAKRHFSQMLALRVSLGIAGDNESSSFSFEDPGFENRDFSSTRSNENSRESARLELNLDVPLLLYVRPQNEVKLFIGGGPSVGYERQSQEANDTSTRIESSPGRTTTQINTLQRDETLTQWSVGSMFTLGGEWFATPRISFTAEYAFALRYTFADREETNSQTSIFRTTDQLDQETTRRDAETNESDSWTWTSPNVLFGLTLYL